MPNFHPVSGQIITLIKNNGFWFETFEHEPVRTSEEAAKVRPNYTLEQGAKALILRVKRKDAIEYVMIVLPGNAKFSNNKVKKLVGTDNITFASVEEVSQLTGGVQVGGVPPFGNLFNLKVLADPAIFSSERIIFNAGDRRFSVGMNSADYKALVQPEIASII